MKNNKNDMKNFKIEKIEDQHDQYLRDESRKVGNACSISFPESSGEIAGTLAYMSQDHTRITIQGARTGVTAGAVPNGGHILNLSRMDRVTGMAFDDERHCFSLMVQPGVLLSQLRKMLVDKDFNTAGWSDESYNTLELYKKSPDWFFPPDPTEESASLGGMAACNSSGACSFLYGPTRKYIDAMEIILPDGSRLDLRRGRDRVPGRSFTVSNCRGDIFKGNLPVYNSPQVKNASGYFASDDMDLVDLFIGSEGTLGVVAGMEIRLLPLPGCIWGMMAFFPSETGALEFVHKIRSTNLKDDDGSINSKPAAIEFFNNNTLKLLRGVKRSNQAFSELPEIPNAYDTAIYTEYHGNSEDDVCSMVMHATELLESCGGNEEATWVAANPKEMGRIHVLRHAVPEAVNLVIDQRRKANAGLTKLGTDMAVPDDRLDEIMGIYNRDLADAGLQSVIFGHIGDNHVHVNILPETTEEYEKGWKLYHEWARRVIEMCGTVSAEHGVGKLKTSLLKQMYGEEGIRQMLAVKQVFDPDGIMNAGNLFG